MYQGLSQDQTVAADSWPSEDRWPFASTEGISSWDCGDRIALLEERVATLELSTYRQGSLDLDPPPLPGFCQYAAEFVEELSISISTATSNNTLTWMILEIMQRYQLIYHAGWTADGRQLWTLWPHSHWCRLLSASNNKCSPAEPSQGLHMRRLHKTTMGQAPGGRFHNRNKISVKPWSLHLYPYYTETI